MRQLLAASGSGIDFLSACPALQAAADCPHLSLAATKTPPPSFPLSPLPSPAIASNLCLLFAISSSVSFLLFHCTREPYYHSMQGRPTHINCCTNIRKCDERIQSNELSQFSHALICATRHAPLTDQRLAGAGTADDPILPPPMRNTAAASMSGSSQCMGRTYGRYVVGTGSTYTTYTLTFRTYVHIGGANPLCTYVLYDYSAVSTRSSACVGMPLSGFIKWISSYHLCEREKRLIQSGFRGQK